MSQVLKDAGWVLVEDARTPEHREWQDPYDPNVRASETKALLVQHGRDRAPASVEAGETRSRTRCARCGVSILAGAKIGHVRTATKPPHRETWCHYCCERFGVKL